MRKRSKLRQTRKYKNRPRPKKDKAAGEEKESDKPKADTGIDPVKQPETQPVEAAKEPVKEPAKEPAKEPVKEVQKTSNDETAKEETPDQTEQADPNPVIKEDTIVKQDETVKEEEPKVQESEPEEIIKKQEPEAEVQNDTQPEDEDENPEEEELNQADLPDTIEPEAESEISEEINPGKEKDSADQPGWLQKLESLMDNQLFHTSKKYYQHAHQKGFQYIDKSVDFLGHHSKEYYNLAKENDTTRNLLVMAIYTFFLIKILNCLSSLCCRRKSVSKHSNTNSAEVEKLSGQVRLLTTQLQTLRSEIQRLNSQSEALAQKINDSKFPVSSNGKAANIPSNGTVPDEKVNEMMSFFTDSLRDVWSQIKVIKANIRENDVSQLSFNFNPNSYRLEGASIGKSKLSPQNEKTIQKEISEAVEYGAKSNIVKDAKKSQRRVPPVMPRAQMVQKNNQVSPTPEQALNNFGGVTQTKNSPHMASNNATQAPVTEIPQPKHVVKHEIKKPIAKRPLPKMKRPGMGRKLKPVKTKKPRFLLNKKPISVMKQPASIAEKFQETKPEDNNIHPEEPQNPPKSNQVIPQDPPVQSDIITESAPQNPNYQAPNVFNTESPNVALEDTQNQPFSMPMPGQVAGVPTNSLPEKRESTQSNHSKQTHISQNKRATNFFAQSQKSEEKQNSTVNEQQTPKPAMSPNSGALQTPTQPQTQRSPLPQSKAPAINEFFAPKTCPNPVAVETPTSEPKGPALAQVQTPAPKISGILGMKNRSKIPSRRIPNRMKRGRKVPKKPIAMKKPTFKKPSGVSAKPKGI